MTTDGLSPHENAVPCILGHRVDFMTLVMNDGVESIQDQRRYSPPKLMSIGFDTIIGTPSQDRACTSHIERSNLSLRMATRRFTRLTNAFYQCDLGLWFAFYNFGRVHMTLKTETPAMASGLEDHVWAIRELIEESAKF